MSDNINTDVHHAFDTLDLLRRSVEDLTTLRRLLRRAKRSGKSVDAGKAKQTLSACLADLIESCAHLSQGDDEDRSRLSNDLAALVIEEDTK